MGVLWIIEKPGRGEASLVSILQGDLAVRVFASVRSFLRLAPIGRFVPDGVLIRCSDFVGELDNLDSILRLNWPTAQRVYFCKVAPEGLAKESIVFDESMLNELPFFLQKLINRAPDISSSTIEMGDILLNPEESRLKILPDGDWIKLSPKEAQLLRHFIRFPNSFLSHEDLCKEVWKDVKVSSKSVASHVSRLRRHLEDSRIEIRSIYGGGYSLVSSED